MLVDGGWGWVVVEVEINFSVQLWAKLNITKILILVRSEGILAKNYIFGHNFTDV